MQVLILSAGMGRRLGALTRDNTKCMLEVNGVKLIDRVFDALQGIDISKVVMVIGYKGMNVRSYIGDCYKGLKVEYVENPIYDRTNNIYSLYLAKEYLLEDDTLLLESDLIFEPELLRKIVECRDSAVALMDKYESWMDGTVVTIDGNRRIGSFISKRNFKYSDIDTYYKTVNIYKFSREFSSTHYVPFLEAYSHALGNNEYYEQVLKVITLLEDSPLKALPLDGENWYEIDDIQDLDIASSMFASSSEERYESITSRYGGYWRYPHLLDFCYLVNPYFPPQNMIDEMKASFEILMRDYPSGMKVNSLLASKNFAVSQDCIVAGNGAAELIKAYMENFCGILGNIVPTFEEYHHRAAAVVSFRPSSADLHYTSDDIISFFKDKKIDTLLLVNPDNPSGNYIAYRDLLELVKWTGDHGIDFVVDESFVDFVDADGLTSLLDDNILANNPHLTVIKSISKSYGVPGFRLGVLASGNKERIAELKKMVSIWNINSYGEFFMQIYEKYHRDYLLACEQIHRERGIFYEELKTIDFLEVIPSQANYFLCRVKGGVSSREMALKLLDENILIKDCSSKVGFDGGNYVRLAVRNREDNHHLCEVLNKMI